MEKPVDLDLDLAVSHTTDALQAIERLNWSMRQDSTAFSSTAVDGAHSSLDHLRELKSSLEGSDHDFVAPQVKEDGLVELKQLTLLHVPSSITDQAREKFTALVGAALKDEVKVIVSITLLTCPWYQESQKERGEMAKHNILLVVFLSHDRQFFSPANPQVKEKASVIDLGWFCAIELAHFGQALGRGRSRHFETVFCREGATIYTSPAWDHLKSTLKFKTVTGISAFRSACVGQAVGSLSKKKKDGRMKLKEGTTLFEICESFRLLQHLDNSVRLEEASPDLQEALLCPAACESLRVVRSFYDHCDPVKCKQDMFDLIMAWKKELLVLAGPTKGAAIKACEDETAKVLGEWMLKARLQGREIKPQHYIEDSHSRVSSLLQEVGGPMANVHPQDILLVALAGSSMYNLNTPSSDLDYLIVYRTPTQTLLSTTKKVVECHESRGVDKDLEYGAYEARTFCEMLLKCSVVILELLFSGSHKYMSPLWNELAAHKKSFVTEKAIQQYLGLIKNNFKFIEKGKHSDAPNRDRKLFYQIFHKLHSLEAMIVGDVPEVRVDGETREFIMNVRTQDKGRWARDSLLTEARGLYNKLRERLCVRTSRLRENPDYKLCTDWMLSVRAL